mmetsp:Transcript_11921/g.34422  ORF Transcript_11921/g.34422 Transcript_11921/m.34422 type:complete len:248 (-) Transcript_11921:1298-2041(-)
MSLSVSEDPRSTLAVSMPSFSSSILVSSSRIFFSISTLLMRSRSRAANSMRRFSCCARRISCCSSCRCSISRCSSRRRSSSSLRRSIVFLRFSVELCSFSMFSRTTSKNRARALALSSSTPTAPVGCTSATTVWSWDDSVVSWRRMLSLSRTTSPNLRHSLPWSRRAWICLAFTATTIIFSTSLGSKFNPLRRSRSWEILTVWYTEESWRKRRRTTRRLMGLMYWLRRSCLRQKSREGSMAFTKSRG